MFRLEYVQVFPQATHVKFANCAQNLGQDEELSPCVTKVHVFPIVCPVVVLNLMLSPYNPYEESHVVLVESIGMSALHVPAFFLHLNVSGVPLVDT